MKLISTVVFSVLFLLSLNVKDSYSQPVTITIGTQDVQSGTGSYGPTNYYYMSYRIQWVITAAEIIAAGGGAGNIESMAYDVSQIAGGDLLNYEVRMAHTTATDASSHDTATLTTVVNSHTFTPGSTGWRTLTFDTPFNWNGTDNILVDVCWGVNSGWSSSGQVWLYNNVANQMRGIRADGSNQCGTITSDTRSGKPRVQLTLPPASNPVLSVTPSSKNFGDVTVNQTSAQVFDITNAGADTLTVNGISVADTTYFKFTDTNSYPVSLVSGQHIYVTVTFTPTNTGSQSTDMTVNSDIDTSTVALSGKGIKYCIPQANCSYEYISNVTFSDLNLTSGSSCTNGYMDSSATHFANIQTYNTYTLSFTVVEGGTEYVRAWFDWNGDYTLDTTEQYSYPTAITVSGTYTMDITVPDSAILDTTRMRVYMKYYSYPTPCVTGGWGEAEDYSVVITAGTPPADDVGISSVVAPGNGQIVDRSGSDVSAYVKNFGTNPASNIDVYYKLDTNSAIGPINIAGPLAPGDSTLVTFTGANQLTSATDVAGALRIYTSFAGDVNGTNDTAQVIVVLVNPLSVPYFEEFTTPAFYTISGTANIWNFLTGVNPAGTAADQMARANFYNFSSGYQYLRTPIIDLTGTSNPVLSFYVTYRSYSGEDDGLEVRVSTDGGMTYDAPLLDKSYLSVPSLATLPNSSSSYTPGAATDWRHEVLDLSVYAGQKIVIGFNAITDYGNNMWIDNIDVTNSANVSIIPVAVTGAYGDLSTDSAQVIFTALRPGLGGGTTPQLDGKISEIVRPEGTIIGELKFADENSPTLKVERNKKGKGNNPGISPDASTGTLVISHFTDFPLNNTFEPNVSATTFNGAIYTPDVISNRYWEISFSGDDYVSEATYDIVLDIRGQLGVVTYDSLYIVKRVDQSGPWVCLSTITEYESGVPVRLRANGISGFSQFGIAAADGTLPVDLIEFNATVDRNNVMLNWSTAWEENNMKFDVQRRPAETEASWQTVGSVKGSGTVHEQRNYSYHDKRLVTGKYEYRLVQVDFDGNITADHNLGSVVEVGIPTEFALSQNYPNPFNPSTKIDFQIPVEGMTKLVIFDLSGREVATLVNETLMPGYYTYDFNASTLASGVYFYRLVSNDNIQTKRMVLIK